MVSLSTTISELVEDRGERSGVTRSSSLFVFTLEEEREGSDPDSESLSVALDGKTRQTGTSSPRVRRRRSSLRRRAEAWLGIMNEGDGGEDSSEFGSPLVDREP